MLKILVLLVASLFTFQSANADIWGLNQVLEATCRVTADRGYGTGSCVANQDGKYYILTNAHVVGNSDDVRLEFFKNGRKTLPLPGKVVFAKLIPDTSVDYALITLDERYFGKDKKYGPRIAKMAKADVKAIGGYVMSAGCPGARWPSGFEGFIIGEQDDQILFYPPPLGGQSGSGLYVVAKTDKGYETVLKGMITWRIEGGVPGKTNKQGYEYNHGGAVLVDSLVKAMEGKEVAKPVAKNYEPVVFERILPKTRLVPSRPQYVIPQKKYVYPVKPKQEVQQNSDMVINPKRLIPLRPKPKPDDNPEPDIDIDIDPTPDVNPDEGNPYEDLPNFDIPVEIDPVPPVVEELDKAEKEKKALEEAKKAAEAEAARIEAEKKALAEKLAAENAALAKRNQLITTVGGGTVGIGGLGALLWALLKKKGKVVALKVWQKKKPELEDRLKNLEEAALAELEAKLGFGVPDVMKAKAELAQKELMKKLEDRLVSRLTGESVKQTVSLPKEMDAVEAHNESLSPEAIAILDDASRHAVLQLVNRTVKNIFKDRPEA